MSNWTENHRCENCKWFYHKELESGMHFCVLRYEAQENGSDIMAAVPPTHLCSDWTHDDPSCSEARYFC